MAEIECVKCECCGLTEECTEAYIKKVQERFEGVWICGLCAEAVENEGCSKEALNRHMLLCKKFKSQRQPREELIPAMKHLILRGLASPRSTPNAVMLRSRSCFSTLDR